MPASTIFFQALSMYFRYSMINEVISYRAESEGLSESKNRLNAP